MKKAAFTVVTECLNIKPLEKVLVLTDRKMLKFGKLLYEASREINLETALMIMEPTGRDGAEPPEIAAKAMKASEVVIAPTYYSLTHTKTRKEACKAGARIASMPRIIEFSFTRGGLTANYSEVRKLTEKIFNKLQDSDYIEIKSKNGTDVYFSARGREWLKDTGIIHKPGECGNLPGGEVYIAPLEESVNGKIVFDFFEFVRGKLGLIVENGIAKEIKGEAKGLEKIFTELGEKTRQVAEFGIGTNPKAKIIGNVLEDEKVYGTIHLALGNNTGFGGRNEVAFHKDGIIKKPTVKVDDKILIKDGKLKV